MIYTEVIMYSHWPAHMAELFLQPYVSVRMNVVCPVPSVGLINGSEYDCLVSVTRSTVANYEIHTSTSLVHNGKYMNEENPIPSGHVCPAFLSCLSRTLHFQT